MRFVPRAVLALVVVGAAVAIFAARGAPARGAVVNPREPGGVANLLGAETAVMTVTIHNAVHANVTTATVGATLHPKVTLAGAFGVPTGEVIGYVFNNAGCLPPAMNKPDGKQLAAGVADLTTTWVKPTVAGKISFYATYSGNATYAPRSSPCVTITITKATASVVLTVHDPSHADVTSVEYGDTAHPNVSVISRAGGPTGNVTLSWWGNGTCSGSKAAPDGIGTLVAGKLDTTYKQLGKPGTYSFRAHYEGDGGFKPADSACTPYAVKKANVAFFTSLHDAGHQAASLVPVEAAVHPYATLNGLPGNPAPSGLIGVWYFSDGACGNALGTGGVSAKPVMDLETFAMSTPHPGALSWRIDYGGDSLYQGKDGPCLKATWKANSTVALTIHDAQHHATSKIHVGEEIHFVTTLSSAFIPGPGGDVSVYAFDNLTCSGTGKLIATAGINDNGIADDTAHRFSFDAPGKHSYISDYAGDASFFGEDSPCKAVTVIAAPKATTTPTAEPATTAAPSAPGSADASQDPGASADAGSSPTAEASSAQPAPTAATGTGTGASATTSPTDAPQVAAAGSTGDSGIIELLLAGIFLLLLVIAFLLWRSRQPRAISAGARAAQ